MGETDRAAAPQTTVARPVCFSGIGLHTGRPSRVVVEPAPPDAGICWQRTDLPGAPTIPATVDAVVGTDRATTIGRGDARVQTIEHVMAALAGLGIDNVLIRIDGPEPPFADGAAAEFVQRLLEAGVAVQDAPRRVRMLTAPVAASIGDAHIVAVPAATWRISYTFVSDNPALGTQFAEYDGTPDGFAHHIAPARTVGWLEEVAALQRRGLALGVTADAAVVVDGDKLLGPMNFPNEVARHKVLDVIGDLALLGPFIAHVIALRSGHRLHVELARRLDAALIDAAAVEATLTEEEKHAQ